MFDSLHPKTSADAHAVVADLVRLTQSMPSKRRLRWEARLAHVYGTFGGQRGLDLGVLRKERAWLGDVESALAAVIALQTYFAFVAQYLACGYASGRPTEFSAVLAEQVRGDLPAGLGAVASGRRLSSLGFRGAEDAFGFEWFVGSLGAASERIWRGFIESLAELSQADYDAFKDLPDPFGHLYAQLIPKNILHALGEFYTPRWLANLLVEEIGLSVGERVLDPFCGSGVFLLAALDSKVESGALPRDGCRQIVGVDLNPAACVAARANLVLALYKYDALPTEHPISLQILCADSFGPALMRAQAAKTPLAPQPIKLVIDGSEVRAISPGPALAAEVVEQLHKFGFELDTGWLDPASLGQSSARGASAGCSPSAPGGRRFWEQHALACLKPCDTIVTNPPWVGWEYQSRLFRDYVQPGWEFYKLYSSGTTHKAFLKEDLSTLALVAVWDTMLKNGAKSVAVIRSATMTSSIASSGLRRLSIHPDRGAIELERVNILDDLRLFSKARVNASTWMVKKGKRTEFPVDARIWKRSKKRWQPGPQLETHRVLEHLEGHKSAVSPTDPADPSGRWMLGARQCIELSSKMTGVCPYKARTGVFTGGANAVYYLELIEKGKGGVSVYSNLIARSKRRAPKVEVELEDELVYEIVRGRDLKRWRLCDHGLLLCPHTSETKMDAISPGQMSSKYPKSLGYLTSMRAILDARGGFTKWEQPFRDRAFYAIQRTGAYTFSEYKVCWKYIAKDFISAVVGPDAHGRPRLANDKIMSIAVDSAAEAYYLCGVLSSSPVRWKVLSHSSGTQISASSVEVIKIPKFSADSALHMQISVSCRDGHRALARNPEANIERAKAAIDRHCAQLFGWAHEDMLAFRADLVALKA